MSSLMCSFADSVTNALNISNMNYIFSYNAINKYYELTMEYYCKEAWRMPKILCKKNHKMITHLLKSCLNGVWQLVEGDRHNRCFWCLVKVWNYKQVKIWVKQNIGNNVLPCLYLQPGNWQNSSSCHSRVWKLMAVSHWVIPPSTVILLILDLDQL